MRTIDKIIMRSESKKWVLPNGKGELVNGLKRYSEEDNKANADFVFIFKKEVCFLIFRQKGCFYVVCWFVYFLGSFTFTSERDRR